MPDRIIRHGILTSDSVNLLSWEGEVFYRRLLSVVDDFGRFDGRRSILRASLYPLGLEKVSEKDVGRMMSECEKQSLVSVYVVDGQQFLEVLKFNQRLRAKVSKWPAPDSGVRSSARACQQPADIGGHQTANAAESESESNTESESKSRSRSFTKPTIEELIHHCAKLGLPEAEAGKFWNFYESKGWKVGTSPMKSWTSAMVNWRARWQERGGQCAPVAPVSNLWGGKFETKEEYEAAKKKSFEECLK